jgi:hypothetical protein
VNNYFSAAPALSGQPQNATLLSNLTLTVTCQVTAGAPFPEVVWTRDGVAVNLSERVRLQQYSASLQFESLELGDSGEYACYVENVNGSAQSESGFITILGTFVKMIKINDYVSVLPLVFF